MTEIPKTPLWRRLWGWLTLSDYGRAKREAAAVVVRNLPHGR